MLDSANACDGFAPQATTDLYAAQFGQILSAIPDSEGETGASEVWLLTHRPVWAVEDDDGQRDQLSHTLQQGLQQALDQNGGTFPQGLTTLVSGHMHYFQSLTFPSGSRPPQLVAGNGGVSLWGSPTGTFSATADGQPAEGLGILEHGFLDIARRPGSSWNGRLLGASGALATCDPARQPRSLCVLENGDT